MEKGRMLRIACFIILLVTMFSVLLSIFTFSFKYTGNAVADCEGVLIDGRCCSDEDQDFICDPVHVIDNITSQEISLSVP